MMWFRLTSCLVLSSVFSFVVACGDDPPPAEPTFPSNPGGITLEANQIGMPLELNRSYAANRVKYDTHAGNIGALFIYEQIFSEYVAATEANGHTDLPERLDDLYEEFEDEIALFDTEYLVIDLQRWDREWIVDWIGGTRDEPENRETYLYFGHDDRRGDYWPEVEARLVDTAQRFVPDAMIIGTEMNRYYAQNPDDWDNYIDFFWQMYDAIKEVNPDIDVAAGFNWAYFMESQVAEWVRNEESSEGVVTLRRAYRYVIDPLVNRYDDSGNKTGQTDFVALAMIPDSSLYTSPSEIPDRYFGALREVFPTGSTPVVFFQLGWPTRSSSSSLPQQFYQHFLDHAGGITIERVAWYGLTHLLQGDCNSLTGDLIGAPETVCYRGMFSDSGAATALSDSYFPE